MIVKNRLINIIETIENQIFEKEDIVKLTLLGLISKENIFLLGQPGVAKSLMARQVCKLIKNGKYFEYLMNSFSTPEELFGPISLKKLDDDIYERKVENYLPESNVVFLDEIWKASPAIQNTLLNIINEKIYINGSNKINVPLNLLISASNELPVENEGLEALYDRFLIRIIVNPIKDDKNFFSLLRSDKNISISFLPNLTFTVDEINSFESHINNVYLSDEILHFILSLKNELQRNLGENGFYVSDRRWKKVAWILKSLAFANDREEVNATDLLIIKHLLWSKPQEIESINEIFDNVFNKYNLDLLGLNFNEMFDIVDKLQQDIQVNSKIVKKTKLINKLITGSTLTSFIEFHTTELNVIKKFLLPVGLMTDNWGKRYIPYGYNIQNKTIAVDFSGNPLSYYYYEKNNEEWVQKIYTSQHFKMLNNNDGYEFNGMKVMPVESNIIVIEDINLLRNLKEKIVELKTKINEIENYKDQVMNYLKDEINILVPNYDYYQSKLLNSITSSFTKVKVSMDAIENQIKEIENNSGNH